MKSLRKFEETHNYFLGHELKVESTKALVRRSAKCDIIVRIRDSPISFASIIGCTIVLAKRALSDKGSAPRKSAREKITGPIDKGSPGQPKLVLRRNHRRGLEVVGGVGITNLVGFV